MVAAQLYDGTNAVRHLVEVEARGDALHLAISDAWEETIPLTLLTLGDRSSSGLTLIHGEQKGWRLRIPAPVPADIDRLFPRRQGYGRWIDRVGVVPAIALFALVSVSVLAVGWFAPVWLAPFVPQSVERAYGQALVGDFGGKFCSSPAGDAALASLTAKLDPHPGELNVRVVDVPVVNAAALPARNIMIFDKLLQETAGPDELAGVLAHEIAHVRQRHVTAALLRQFGVSIFATALGGTTATHVDGFVGLNFTRRAEGEADRVAIATLDRAHISPAPTAGFFRKLKRLEGDAGRLTPALAYLSSHPLSGDRERLFSDAAKKDAAYRPALSPQQWAALRSICKSR